MRAGIYILMLGLPVTGWAAFASIAHSPSTGLWGAGWRQPDRASADRQAIANCYAPDCQVQVWGQNTCIALAVNNDYQRSQAIYSWAYDRSVLNAQRAALDRCFLSSQGCGLVASICSD